LDLSLEQDKRRRSEIKRKSARVKNTVSSEVIDKTQKLRDVHVHKEQRSDWVAGDNVDPLFRLQATVPGDIAVRFAAIVIVILIIAYK